MAERYYRTGSKGLGKRGDGSVITESLYIDVKHDVEKIKKTPKVEKTPDA